MGAKIKTQNNPELKIKNIKNKNKKNKTKPP